MDRDHVELAEMRIEELETDVSELQVQIEELTRERNEARATKDMHKERQEEYLMRAEQAEARLAEAKCDGCGDLCQHALDAKVEDLQARLAKVGWVLNRDGCSSCVWEPNGVDKIRHEDGCDMVAALGGEEGK